MRAFTIWPAEIFGVENQLGSIEAGKIANLTVTRGDLFDRNSRVAHVFIDGRPVDLRPPARLVVQGAHREWNVDTSTLTWVRAREPITLTLQQEGDRLTGSISGLLGAGEISNASTSSAVKFALPFR